MPKVKRVVQIIHRWLGLLLFAQLVAWMASGVVMSWFPTELVKGETATLDTYPLSLEAVSYASPGGVIAQMEDVKEVRLKRMFNVVIYEVTSASETAIFNADTGEKLSPISEKMARTVARKDFVGDAEIESLNLLFKTPNEYRGPLPVWQATFGDQNETRLYISPSTAEVVARRNRIWRLYDFFWMLHIMDYEEREDFNNPLVKVASVTGLLFAFSGVFLIVIRLKNGRYLKDLQRKD